MRKRLRSLRKSERHKRKLAASAHILAEDSQVQCNAVEIGAFVPKTVKYVNLYVFKIYFLTKSFVLLSLFLLWLAVEKVTDGILHPLVWIPVLD